MCHFFIADNDVQLDAHHTVQLEPFGMVVGGGFWRGSIFAVRGEKSHPRI